MPIKLNTGSSSESSLKACGISTLGRVGGTGQTHEEVGVENLKSDANVRPHLSSVSVC